MYPTSEELDKIAEWPHTDFKGLLSYIKERWTYVDDYWREEDDTYYLSTAGWSGNEDIIQALKENYLFWSLCWYRSERGGHYKFVIPKLK